MKKNLFVLLVLVGLSFSLTACSHAPQNVVEALAVQAVTAGKIMDVVPDTSGTLYHVYVCDGEGNYYRVTVNTYSATDPKAGDPQKIGYVLCGDRAAKAVRGY